MKNILRLLPLALILCAVPAVAQTATIELQSICPSSYDYCYILVDSPPYPHTWTDFGANNIGFVQLYMQPDIDGVTHSGYTDDVQFIVSAPPKLVAGSVVTVTAQFSMLDTETGITYPNSIFSGVYTAYQKHGRYGGLGWLCTERITLQ